MISNNKSYLLMSMLLTNCRITNGNSLARHSFFIDMYFEDTSYQWCTFHVILIKWIKNKMLKCLLISLYYSWSHFLLLSCLSISRFIHSALFIVPEPLFFIVTWCEKLCFGLWQEERAPFFKSIATCAEEKSVFPKM